MDGINSEAKALADFFKEKGTPLSYKKGRRLLAGDIANQVLFVKSGYVIAYLVTQSSASRMCAYYTFGPGDLIQIRLLIADARLELAYSALTNTVLYAVPRGDIWSGMRSNPLVVRGFVRDVIYQNELHARRIENLSYRYASDKLIYRILNLAERFGTPRDGTISIGIPVTHRQVGLFINMARESVSREMEKLANRGLIRYERQHITILDLPELAGSLHETVRTDWDYLFNMVPSSRIERSD